MIDDDKTFPEIPEFLKLTSEERRAAWSDFDRRKKDDPSIKVTRPGPGGPARPAHASPGSGPPETSDSDKASPAASLSESVDWNSMQSWKQH